MTKKNEAAKKDTLNEAEQNPFEAPALVTKEEYEKIVKQLELKTEDFKSISKLYDEVGQKHLLAKTNVEVLTKEKKELAELVISQKAQIEKVVSMQSQPFIFWAFINNRTEFVAKPSYEELVAYLKAHKQLKSEERFIAAKFIDETKISDEEYLSLLIHNTFARLEQPSL